MPLSYYVAICAGSNFAIIFVIFIILIILRKNGKSDLRQSRIVIVVASFALPIITTGCFVIAAIIMQRFFASPIPIGQYGGGVFVILASTVGTSMLSLLIFLPLIRHKKL